MLAIVCPACASQPSPNVVLRGAATDCAQAERVRPRGVAVLAFDARENRRILALLSELDAATFAEDAQEAMARFDSQYVRLMSAITSSPPLARAMTDTAGAFALELPRTDSVLVFAHAELEGEPFYFSHAVVGGLTDKTFELDMSKGGCAYLDSLDTR